MTTIAEKSGCDTPRGGHRDLASSCLAWNVLPDLSRRLLYLHEVHSDPSTASCSPHEKLGRHGKACNKRNNQPKACRLAESTAGASFLHRATAGQGSTRICFFDSIPSGLTDGGWAFQNRSMAILRAPRSPPPDLFRRRLRLRLSDYPTRLAHRHRHAHVYRRDSTLHLREGRSLKADAPSSHADYMAGLAVFGHPLSWYFPMMML